jgi:hypothetical protein
VLRRRNPREEDDEYVLRRWWAGVSPSVPRDVVALWFGIAELDLPDASGRHLEVAGCDRFDDDTTSWVASAVWWPKSRYVRPPRFSTLAGDRDAVVEAAARLVETLEPQTYVAFPLSGVAVGFDADHAQVTWSRGMGRRE